jgi:hypothetical protein
MGATRRRFANFLDTYLQHYLLQQDQTHQSELVQARQQELAKGQAADRLMEMIGKDPGIAARARAAGVQKVGDYDISNFIPTDDERAGHTGGRISSAADLAHLPTDQDIETDYFGQPGSDRSNRAPIETLMAQRRARDEQLRRDMSPVPTEAYNPATHAQETKFLPGDPRLLTGQTVQKAPNATQLGENQGLTATAAQPGQTAAEVAKTNALAGPQARAAGLAAGASASAAAPFHPQYFVNDDGDLVPVTAGAKGSVAGDALVGVHPTGNRNADGTKPLPANALATVAVGNNAEIQGVKLLATLKASGLDKSNDPMDPRWNQFLMGTLKLAPSDIQAADINQRANFIEAAMMKTLLAGRPNKTLIDLYSKHLAGATSTGKLMYHNLKLILEQNKGLRDQYEAQGFKVGQPVGGMTFDDWQKNDVEGPAEVSPLDSARNKAKQLGGGL